MSWEYDQKTFYDDRWQRLFTWISQFDFQVSVKKRKSSRKTFLSHITIHKFNTHQARIYGIQNIWNILWV